jgi:primosomal protein N' (replication factor Y)
VQGFARVAIDSRVSALDRPFDYAIPERMLERLQVGSVVRVVLHGRNVRAFVTELLDEPAVAKARPISSLVSPEPVFDEATIRLAAWVGRRYLVPLGLVLHDAVPGRFSASDSGESYARVQTTARPPWLKDDPSRHLGEAREFCAFPPTLRDEPELIAYLVGRAVTNSHRALVICPRVDVVERVADAIPGSVVLHGEDRPAERAASWAAARDGRVDVVVGGRSALLAPVPDLGLVIVTSAHDQSLKSERAPRVHGVVVARQRARLAGATFIASSPAPPVEVAAADGITWITSKRSAVRPEITRPKKGPVTPRLIEVVRSSLDSGRDALVFAGRRGDVLRLRCVDCGWGPVCAKCGAGLGVTAGAGSLTCRVCSTSTRAPDECGACGGRLSERGWGHERIARELERLGVGGVVERVVAGGELEHRDEPTVVVGTLAAVHAVRDVGAACVADLDQLLGRPDFRAAERALQVLHEIAGVLAPDGRFLVQTRESDHPVVQSFTRGSYRFFLDRELPFREETTYPPFGVVVRAEVDPANLDDLERALHRTGGRLVGALPIPRRKSLGALIRAPKVGPLLDPLRAFSAAHPTTRIDIDPIEIT